MSVVIIGKNSMMGQEMQNHFSGTGWIFLDHKQAQTDLSWADKAHCVINFAFSPFLRHHEYNADQDIDLKLARSMNAQCHYVMISSRAVYGSGTSNRLFETDTPRPQTFYGQNKWRIEQQLNEMLAARLTVLRCANVFGHEYGRRSFFGMALTNLKNMGEIVFDMNPEVRRDFIAVWHVARAIGQIAQTPKAGLYNLGSGYGTACHDIASWIIKGYGHGNLIATSDERRDDFYLDMTKTKTAFNPPVITHAMLEQDCFDCGKKLRGLSA